MGQRKYISTLTEYINESKVLNCKKVKLTDEVIEEIKKFKSSEDLLRSGGISIEALDRAAFGFSVNDIKTLMPKELHIRWKDDLENVKHEVDVFSFKYGNIDFKTVKKMWAMEIDLTEPIDVSYINNKFYIEDGHHRYYAAKILNKPLNVSLEIKSNPISKLSSLSYDDFHRCIFNQVNT